MSPKPASGPGKSAPEPPPPAPPSPAQTGKPRGERDDRAGGVSHLERIAEVLPEEHRGEWRRMAAQYREATYSNHDEIFLLGEIIAFSGLIAHEAFEQQQVLSKQLEEFSSTATADVTGAIRRFHSEVELTSKSLVNERLEEMRGVIAENLKKTIILPDIRDFREMGDRLTKDLDMLRAVIDKLTAKAGVKPPPAGESSAPSAPQKTSGADLAGIKRALFTCVFLLLAGAGGLGFWIWREAGKARADITSRVSEHELSYELAGTGGGLQLRDAVSVRTKENVRELVIDGGYLKVKDAFLTGDGRGVIHLDARIAPGKKSMFSK